MKQSIKSIPAIIFFSLVLFTQSFAQDMIAANKVPSEKRMLSSEVTKTNEITAESNFSALFPNATEQQWKVISDNTFVFFLNDGRQGRASFNEKGAMNYVITNCSIKDLPADFSHSINTRYAAYKLFHAIEIKAYGQTAYHAIMENAGSFITLKHTVDGVEEIGLVNKQ